MSTSSIFYVVLFVSFSVHPHRRPAWASPTGPGRRRGAVPGRRRRIVRPVRRFSVNRRWCWVSERPDFDGLRRGPDGLGYLRPRQVKDQTSSRERPVTTPRRILPSSDRMGGGSRSGGTRDYRSPGATVHRSTGQRGTTGVPWSGPKFEGRSALTSSRILLLLYTVSQCR